MATDESSIGVLMSAETSLCDKGTPFTKSTPSLTVRRDGRNAGVMSTFREAVAHR